MQVMENWVGPGYKAKPDLSYIFIFK